MMPESEAEASTGIGGHITIVCAPQTGAQLLTRLELEECESVGLRAATTDVAYGVS